MSDVNSIPQLRAEDLSRLPVKTADEPGLRLIAYDRDNPAAVVQIPVDGLAAAIDAADADLSNPEAIAAVLSRWKLTTDRHGQPKFLANTNGNTLAIQNINTGTYSVSSIRFQMPANTYPAVSGASADGKETFAIGYSGVPGNGVFSFKNYIETSNDPESEPNTNAPTPLIIVQTGYLNGAYNKVARWELKDNGDMVMRDWDSIDRFTLGMLGAITINASVAVVGNAVTAANLLPETLATSAVQFANLRPPTASGTNTAGTNLNIYGGAGTGTGTGGLIMFSTAPAGSSGASANAFVNRWGISQGGTFYAAFDNTLNIGSATDLRPADIFVARNFVRPIKSIAFASTVTVQFSGSTGQQWQDVATLTGDIEFAGSNYAAGREVIVRVVSDASIRNLTFPAGWRFVGTKPANIAAGKAALLKLRSWGTTEASVVAEWIVET